MRVKDGNKRSLLLTLVNQVEDVAGIAAEPVEPGHHQFIAWPQEIQNSCQLGASVATASRDLFGVTLENGAASGLAYTTSDGQNHTATAKAEVILAAGALATPKLMMLSGLGPGGHLAGLGIPVIREMPSVGGDLQDNVVAPSMR